MPRKRAPRFTYQNTRPFTMRVRVTMTLPAWVRSARRNAAILAANDALMEQLMRRALAETVLLAYRKRFLSGLPGAVNMQRLKVSARRSDPVIGARRMKELMDAMRARDKLSERERYHEGRVTLLEKGEAQLRVSRAQTAVREALTITPDQRRAPDRPRLASGRFRSLALQILSDTSNASNVQRLDQTGNAMTLAVGNRRYLDTIQTPSATTGKVQRRDILWRHLEFGTGVFSTRKQDQLPEYRYGPNGAWFYGQNPEFALRLKGSKGVHALYDPATGLRYDEDYRRFTSVFSAHLAAALRGQ